MSISQSKLQLELQKREILSFIGVYDVFSASIAARYFDGIFISGFSFAASFYGLPDIGFIAWSDIVAFVQRVRKILPHHFLLVDIDDGYADTEVACHVVSLLESAGASGVVLEDQQRPRKCGHFEGKQLMELNEFTAKLKRVMQTRRDMFIIARTDADDPEEIARRVRGFTEAGADAVLVDALRNLDLLKELKNHTQKPFAFNQIAGGKSPLCSVKQLREAGASIVIYSTPCLFAAQSSVEEAMKSLRDRDGLLNYTGKESADLRSCASILNENLARRDSKE